MPPRPFGFLGIPIVEEECGCKGTVRASEIRIQPHGLKRALSRLFKARRRLFQMVRRQQHPCVRQCGMCSREPGVTREGSFVMLDGAPKTVLGPLVPVETALQVEVV